MGVPFHVPFHAMTVLHGLLTNSSVALFAEI